MTYSGNAILSCRWLRFYKKIIVFVWYNNNLIYFQITQTKFIDIIFKAEKLYRKAFMSATYFLKLVDLVSYEMVFPLWLQIPTFKRQVIIFWDYSPRSMTG